MGEGDFVDKVYLKALTVLVVDIKSIKAYKQEISVGISTYLASCFRLSTPKLIYTVDQSQ